MMKPEEQEHVAVVQWLNYQNIPHYCIRNEETIKTARYLYKRKMMGWNPGVSDLLIIVPANKCKHGRSLMLWLEMKRRKEKGVSPKPSAHQLAFIDLINQVADNSGKVCYGSDEAISWVSQFLEECPS